VSEFVAAYAPHIPPTQDGCAIDTAWLAETSRLAIAGDARAVDQLAVMHRHNLLRIFAQHHCRDPGHDCPEHRHCNVLERIAARWDEARRAVDEQVKSLPSSSSSALRTDGAMDARLLAGVMDIDAVRRRATQQSRDEAHTVDWWRRLHTAGTDPDDATAAAALALADLLADIATAEYVASRKAEHDRRAEKERQYAAAAKRRERERAAATAAKRQRQEGERARQAAEREKAAQVAAQQARTVELERRRHRRRRAVRRAAAVALASPLYWLLGHGVAGKLMFRPRIDLAEAHRIDWIFTALDTGAGLAAVLFVVAVWHAWTGVRRRDRAAVAVGVALIVTAIGTLIGLPQAWRYHEAARADTVVRQRGGFIDRDGRPVYGDCGIWTVDPRGAGVLAVLTQGSGKTCQQVSVYKDSRRVDTFTLPENEHFRTYLPWYIHQASDHRSPVAATAVETDGGAWHLIGLSMSPSSLTNAWTLNDPQFTGAFTKVRIGDLLVIEGATKLVAVQLSDGSIRWTHGCPAGPTLV
jgi:hypothetical protein